VTSSPTCSNKKGRAEKREEREEWRGRVESKSGEEEWRGRGRVREERKRESQLRAN
jgi:hypothetical protein